MSATSASTVAADKVIEELIADIVAVNNLKDVENVSDDASTVVGTFIDSADFDVDSYNEEMANIDEEVNDLIEKAISTPCSSPKKTHNKVLPQSSPVRKTNLAAKSNAKTLKRQRSTESFGEDFTKAKKSRGESTASKKEPPVKATETTMFKESSIAATRNVPSDLKFIFEIGPKDEQRVLLFTKGKQDILKTHLSVQSSTSTQKIFDLIGRPKVVLPEYFTTKFAADKTVFQLRKNEDQLAMLRAHPYLAIRALQQGLFDFAFHGIPTFKEGPQGGVIVGRYLCGMTGCEWKADKEELMDHLATCDALKELNKRVGEANGVFEEDPESKEEM
ncbi:hypothetical protein CYLTODRAFT_414262 [Cylindrobasidium torrendii FP15055 ss-10]|uniref:Uncharacterized protein n=1 Tax=Cylindrobasidium torrendii FP15055 ss-10 TaxID=1314674 RepID=A0A0D7AXY7_9AGAR|nr:hypothetical protein CYLTODRAFT_414262 [Cylindrobasidium torrendii FP15055 ss-10]